MRERHHRLEVCAIGGRDDARSFTREVPRCSDNLWRPVLLMSSMAPQIAGRNLERPRPAMVWGTEQHIDSAPYQAKHSKPQECFPLVRVPWPCPNCPVKFRKRFEQ